MLESTNTGRIKGDQLPLHALYKLPYSVQRARRLTARDWGDDQVSPESELDEVRDLVYENLA